MGKNTFNLPFVNVQDNKYPFIEGAIVDKDGQVLEGYFLIDSGSVPNMLNSGFVKYLDTKAISGNKIQVTGVDNIGEACSMVKMEIELDGVRTNEDFYVSQNINFEKYFEDVVLFGILGTSFLIKHRMVIDYENECLKTAALEPISLDEKSFFFPIEYGVDTYNAPIVGLVNGGSKYLCMLDTGCTENIIAEGVMPGLKQCRRIEEKSEFGGISGVEETELAMVSFLLLSMDKTGKFCLVEHEDECQILLGHEFLFNGDDRNLPSISGLLGGNFMLKRKWVLDFGNMAIYAK